MCCVCLYTCVETLQTYRLFGMQQCHQLCNFIDTMYCAYLLQENAGGVSRDEMAAVLMEVVDGRLPKDRIALRELYNEIIGWPWLEAEEDQTEGIGEAVADYEGITPTGMRVSYSNMDWCLPGHSDL